MTALLSLKRWLCVRTNDGDPTIMESGLLLLFRIHSVVLTLSLLGLLGLVNSIDALLPLQY